MGLMNRRPAFSLTVNTTKTYRPTPFFPTASKRVSLFWGWRSGRMKGSPRSTCSISPFDTPCLPHFGQFPSSQSKPATWPLMSSDYTDGEGKMVAGLTGESTSFREKPVPFVTSNVNAAAPPLQRHHPHPPHRPLADI